MTALTAIRREDLAPALNQDLNGILHLLTCGSVDDGKSTLIGRLLWDASDLYDDQRETINRSSNAATGGAHPDFSLLLDGLVAEREQGITIDIAWRYFDTATRRFVVIDSPGHEQYTRNMASGASHADVAIMLVDARHGVKRQTRRHAAILDIVGVKRVILAVNKMDLVDWSQERFRAIEADFRELTLRFGFREAIAIPVSAVGGDNVARRSEHMPWYTGPHLLEHLERIPPRDIAPRGPFRLPVQTVLRDGLDFRGLAGTVALGLHQRRRPRHRRAERAERARPAHRHHGPRPRDSPSRARPSPCSSTPTSTSRAAPCFPWPTIRRPSPRSSRRASSGCGRRRSTRAPVTSCARQPTSRRSRPSTSSRCSISRRWLRSRRRSASVNDIAIASITLGRPVAVDTFADNQPTGAFLIVDAITGATVAGGVIAGGDGGNGANASAFKLTRELLERGLCRDLGDSDEDRREFQRRASEAALLLHAAGIPVKIEL